MLFVKIALWTCAFYLGFWLAAELAYLATVRWKGSGAGGVIFNLWSWVLVSGIVWLVSTSLAYRVVASGIRPNLSR
jgi:hypothetical protein